MSDQEKDLELMILRTQLDMAERKLHKPVRPTRAEKMTLAVLVARLKGCSGRTRLESWTVCGSVEDQNHA